MKSWRTITSILVVLAAVACLMPGQAQAQLQASLITRLDDDAGTLVVGAPYVQGNTQFSALAVSQTGGNYSYFTNSGGTTYTSTAANPDYAIREAVTAAYAYNGTGGWTAGLGVKAYSGSYTGLTVGYLTGPEYRQVLRAHRDRHHRQFRRPSGQRVAHVDGGRYAADVRRRRVSDRVCKPRGLQRRGERVLGDP